MRSRRKSKEETPRGETAQDRSRANRPGPGMFRVFAVLLCALLVLFTILLHRYDADRPGTEPIVIAIPYSDRVQDYETNYYTGWLEEQTGYDITFVYLDEGYEKEALNLLLAAEHGSVDAVFLPEDQDILSEREYHDYLQGGLLAAPQDYLELDSHLCSLAADCPEVEFDALFGKDGRLYCFPSVNLARTGQNLQILWINIDWLTRLGLTIPRTTEEFFQVLCAFRDGDPNGNGIADELPLVSCEAEASLRSYRYLLNAFSYYDTENLSWYGADGRVAAGVEEAAFREGVAYCASLYEQGLLRGDTFSYTKKQLMELINDPTDTVGAFASHSIADVVYMNNPGVLAHFVQLAPLSSDALEKGYAVNIDIRPGIGGLIPANAPHKEAAAQIMDLMLSKEGSLIALYGEKDVDWRFSRDGELSTYGARANITTIRYLKGREQNQNYAGAGPLLAAAEATDGVTWTGDHSMTEYIDARAVKAYEPYYLTSSKEDREVVEKALGQLSPARKRVVSGYLEAEVLRFLTGEREAENDADWQEFLEEYGRLTGR